MMVQIVTVIYAVILVIVVWGWVRWAKHRRLESAGAKFSFAGFLLATLSILLAIFAVAIGGFRSYGSQLSIIGAGSLLSLAALIGALIGLWRRNSLRWHALVCSLGSLVFWVIAMEGQ